MFFLRSFLFFLFAVIISSAALFLFGKYINPAEIRGSYAVLKVDKDLDDNAILELLNEEKQLFSGSIISESTQWVLLDEFDSVSVIPLNEYYKRILPFDPRNDGYAEKLSSFFVRDDIRRFFIPLKNSNSVTLEKQIKNLLGNIPFSVGFYGIGKPYHLYFISFASAVFCTALIFIFKRQRRQLHILLLLPVLFLLSFFGAAGIAVSSLIFGLLILTREPLNELFYIAGLPSGDIKKTTLFSRYVFEPNKSNLPLIIIFILSICGITYLFEIQPLFIILVIAITFTLYFWSLRAVSFSSNHRRFSPLNILKRKNINADFPLFMLPFIAASIATVFLTPNVSGNLISNEEINFQLDKNDYYNHLDYQISFSLLQLDSLNGNYPDFLLDDNGLPNNSSQSNDKYADMSKYPSFPLEHLLSFLNKVNNNNKVQPESYNIPFNNYFLFLLIIFLVPLFNKNLLKNQNKNNILFSLKKNKWYKRNDINKKKHYYNNIKIRNVS